MSQGSKSYSLPYVSWYASNTDTISFDVCLTIRNKDRQKSSFDIRRKKKLLKHLSHNLLVLWKKISLHILRKQIDLWVYDLWHGSDVIKIHLTSAEKKSVSWDANKVFKKHVRWHLPKGICCYLSHAIQLMSNRCRPLTSTENGFLKFT